MHARNKSHKEKPCLVCVCSLAYVLLSHQVPAMQATIMSKMENSGPHFLPIMEGKNCFCLPNIDKDEVSVVIAGYFNKK